MAKILGVTTFTKEGAAYTYQRMSQRFSDNPSLEASMALGEAAEALHDLGFPWEEIEKLETTDIEEVSR